MSNDNKWSKPTNPPPPLFLGEKERNLVKQVNDELLERVIGQQILYLPVSMDFTDFHPLYGEAINKSFLPPVRIYALIEFDGIKTVTENYGLDKDNFITVKFHERRLHEDQDVYVREGDYVQYGDAFYEIVTLTEERQLFGQVDHLFQIVAKCIKTRKGLVDLEVLSDKAYRSAIAAASLISPATGGSGEGSGGSGGGSEGSGGGGSAARVVFSADTGGALPGVLSSPIAAGSSVNSLFDITGDVDYTTIMIFVNGILQSVSDAPGVSDFYVKEGEIKPNFTLSPGNQLTIVFLTALASTF